MLQKKAESLLLKVHQLPVKAACRRCCSGWHLCRSGLTNGVLPCFRHRLIPQGQIFQLDFQRKTHHQPAQVANDSAMGGKPRFASFGACRPRKEPLAHFRYSRIPLDHPTLTSAIVAQGTHGLRRVFSRSQVGRQELLIPGIFLLKLIVRHASSPSCYSAIPHSRFRHTSRTGLPARVWGRSTLRSATTINADIWSL